MCKTHKDYKIHKKSFQFSRILLNLIFNLTIIKITFLENLNTFYFFIITFAYKYNFDYNEFF